MKETAIIDLAQNLAILLAFTMLYENFWLKNEVSKRLWSKIITGLFLGGIGIVLILTPWTLRPGILIDARAILLSISGLFFGPIPTITAMLLTGFFRVVKGGDGMWMGIATIISSGTIGLLWRQIRASWRQKNVFIELFAMGMIVYLARIGSTFLLPLLSADIILIIKTTALPLFLIDLSGIMLLGFLMLRQSSNFQNRLSILKEVANRKSAMDALKREQYLMNVLMDTLPDHVYFKDKESRFIRINVALAQSFGLSAPEEAIGKTDFDFFTEEHARQAYKDEQAIIQSGNPLFKEEKNTWVDHRVTWVSTIKLPIEDHEGNIVGTFGISRDITERKRAEERLIEQSEAMEAAIDGLAILDPYQNYIYMNKSHAGIYGYDNANELIGASWRVLYDTSELQRFDKEIFPELSQKGHYQGRALGKKKDGSIFPQDLSLTALENGGMICTVRDITERKRLEKSFEESKKTIERYLNVAAEIILSIDTLGNITLLNDSGHQLLGYNRGELIGKNWFKTCLPHEMISEVSSVIEKLKNGDIENVVQNENVVKTKSGEIRTILWHNTLLKDLDGNITGLISSGEDFTERKQIDLLLLEKNEEYQQINEELSQTNIELIKAKEHAEESDLLKSAFLANMSHEIRTPMNGILGFADLLEEQGFTDEERHEYIKIIKKSGVRMLNIINDLIDISKVESGQMEISISETNVNEQIEYIYTFFKPEVERKGLQIFFQNGLPAKEAVIETDREKIYAILTNLVKNAIKYSDTGTIEFGYTLKDKYLEFFIKDTGIGIPHNKKEVIFDRFIQADIADTRAFQGAGLGLAISKAYVEMLGGRIWVESELGKGSTFYFTIPCNGELQERNVIKNIVPAEETENQIKNLKILIAEDDETSEMLLTKIMTKDYKDVLHVKTGVEAVEACLHHPDIDLVLMDIQMPEMDGYEATRQIRQFNKEVIIIAQTAYGFKGDREKVLEAGCNDYIPKPINKALLKELIKKHFNSAR